MDQNNVVAASGEPKMVQPTLIALFDDTIDAEHALVALRKAEHDADRVSLMVRDKSADEREVGDRAVVVARAMVATALEAVGGWLQGLAELILPEERGTYLVAGPMGAALARISTAGRLGAADEEGAAIATADLDADVLHRMLTEFGIGPEEASYVKHRLAAGAVLVAVTTNDRAALQATRRIFADHDAVYIGLAQTDAGFFQAAEALLAAPPQLVTGGEIVIADAVARLRRVSQEDASELAALRDRDVVDAHGDEVGVVDEVLAEVIDPDGSTGPEPQRFVLRYLIVGFGGVLGLGRRRIAVPAPLADLAANPIAVRIDKDVLHRAPAYVEDAPLSRREEQAISSYFDVPPYWEEGG